MIVGDQEISAFTKYRTINVGNSKHLNPFDLTEKQENHFQNYPSSKIFEIKK